ncbi:conserved hypothetical protein TIGR01655 [Amphibacillus marinus]|uniref:YxeA family protein n=1 Tax=Amphibacillus marinus TaxID=872970 RepID=A0A1H8KH88_9BACI|nr:YxeA family protein [Amphibacillus marinus]SEN92330.1 conserved hypothetical protein TIGR01655 [Amphibacillus marinus]
MKKLLIAFVIVCSLLIASFMMFRESLDRFNPFIEQEHVYVEIDNEPTDDDGRYKYSLRGYNVAGDSKRVTFTTSVRLEKGTYLKVWAKGAYTESWESIDEEELPSGVNF